MQITSSFEAPEDRGQNAAAARHGRNRAPLAASTARHQQARGKRLSSSSLSARLLRPCFCWDSWETAPTIRGVAVSKKNSGSATAVSTHPNGPEEQGTEGRDPSIAAVSGAGDHGAQPPRGRGNRSALPAVAPPGRRHRPPGSDCCDGAFPDAGGYGGGAGAASSAAGSCGGAAGLDEAHPVAAAALGPHELDVRGVSSAEALEAARRRHCGPGRRVRPVQHLRRTRKGGHLLGCLRAAADTSETRGTRKSITLLARRSVKDPTPGRWAPATRPPRRRMRHSDQSGSRVGRAGARRQRQAAEREQARE